MMLVAFYSCNQTAKQTDINQSDSIAKLQKENDSLENVISKNVLKPDSTLNKVDDTFKKVKGGVHPVTLQWIGWDKPGSVKVEPIEGDWYSIKGGQENTSGQYLKIEGKIKRITEKELLFDGKIITKVTGINSGEPCLKNGEQTFFAKGDRKYFRLQNMTNCEGGTVDYVDIYIGTSSL